MALSQSQILLLQNLKQQKQKQQSPQAQARDSLIFSQALESQQTISDSASLNELRTKCLFLFCTRSIRFWEFKKFAEWLGGYQNVLPADRVLNERLMQYLVSIFGWSHSLAKSYFISCYEERHQLAVLYMLQQGD